jgi:molecular chaperone HtpG
VTAANFQVNLRGVVELLAHHLYSSPRVYLRELLQNAVDACTARRQLDPSAPPARVVVEPGSVFAIHDNGVGLTAAEVEEFLATVGHSSKQDTLDGIRGDFLGRFGIGLLSAFMVSDEITVRTRSAREPDAPTIEWRATADGRYSTHLAAQPRPEPGTTVLLRPRADTSEWLSADRVTELAQLYGSLLPVEVLVGGVPITRPAPWRASYPSALARRSALAQECQDAFGFAPFEVIDLAVPEAGLTGVAYVLPQAVPPSQQATHRVWLKGMLLGERVEQLLPEWAFFVRATVDVTELRPTASREALYDDALLELVRERLGAQLREWLSRLTSTDPDRATAFLRLHHLGVKSLALHDDAMLTLVLPWLPFETTLGTVTLAEFRRTHPVVQYTATVDDFRRVAAVATAQGLGVVNAGYVYDVELLTRIAAVHPEWTVEQLDTAVVNAHLDAVDGDEELRWRHALGIARSALEPFDCDVELRAFDPVSVPALHLDDRDAVHERDRRAAVADADDLWSEILSGLAPAGAARARLILNQRNPLVRRLRSLADAELLRLAVEALYVQALLLAHRPLRPAESALLGRSYLTLLDRAVSP